MACPLHQTWGLLKMLAACSMIEPDSYDSIAGSTDRIVTHVLGRIKPGSIILLHAMNHLPSFDAVAPLLAQLGQQG